MSPGRPHAPSVNHLADPVFAIDSTGVLRYANDTATDVLGWDATELLGTGMLDLVHPDDVTLATAALHTVVDKAFGDLLTLRIRTGRGTWRHLEFRGAVPATRRRRPVGRPDRHRRPRRHRPSPARLRPGRHRGTARGDGEHA